MIPQEIEVSLKAFLEKEFQFYGPAISYRPVGGGCINYAMEVRTAAGSFFLKYNDARAFPGMFDAEKKGLILLGGAHELKVPGVIHTAISGNYSYILMEFITSAPEIPDFMEDFGRSLAKLHMHHDHLFGMDHDNFMGSLPQSNRFHPGWVTFFIEERLETQVRLAEGKGLLPADTRKQFERLYTLLPGILPAELPSLLHGDLWGGNYMISGEGKACLIDPAVYYGHREIDLAMSRLFGGFGEAFYRCYQESFPLEHGWEERVGVYNLYPLLVHLNLFGSSYLGQIKSVLRKF